MSKQARRLATPVMLLSPAHVMLLSAPVFWGGNFIVGRALRGDVPPVSLNFWRWAIALAILLPLNVRRLKRYRALLRAEWKLVVVLSLTGVTCFNTFSYQALTTTTAINALLFLSTAPLLMVLVSRMLFGDVLSRGQALGILVSLPGAALLVAEGNLSNLLHLQLNRGDVWMLGAVVVWTLFSVLLKRAPAELPKTTLLTATVLVGLAALAPVYAWRLYQGERLTLTAGGAAGMLYVGLCASVIAFTLWSKGIAEVGPGRAGVYMHVMPLSGAILANVLLGEAFAAHHLFGGALIAAGIAMTNWQVGVAGRVWGHRQLWPELTQEDGRL